MAISSARADVQFGSPKSGQCFRMRNVDLVLGSKCGRDFFRSIMTAEQASLVSREISVVRDINPRKCTVTLYLCAGISQFGLKKKNEARWTTHLSGNLVELSVGDCLRHEMAWSEAEQKLVVVPAERQFKITLVHVEPPHQSSSTSLLDQLLGSGMLAIDSDAGAVDESLPDRREQKEKYDKESEVAKKRMEHYKQMREAAKENGVDLEKDESLQRARKDLVNTYRALLRMRPPLMSDIIQFVGVLVRRFPDVRRKVASKSKKKVATILSKAEKKRLKEMNKQPYTLEELRDLVPDAKRKVSNQSNSMDCIKTAMKRHENGGGLRLTSVQKELVRVHISDEENFSVEEFIGEFPLDQRHRETWSHSKEEHVDAVQDWNELILKELERYEEVRLYLALVRAMQLEPTEPRERMKGESKGDYRTYMYNFKQDLIKEANRPSLKKEEEKLKAEILKRKADIQQHLSETFAVHRLQDGFFALVNFDPDDVFKDNMFAPGVCVAYDTRTGVTTFQGHHDSSKIAHIAICDYRVRFSPKYAPRTKVDPDEFEKHRKRLSLNMHWNRIRKGFYNKSKTICKKRTNRRV